MKLFQWILEQGKAASDVVVVLILRGSSRFGRELNDEGREEQRMWREQRLRNIRGLAAKSLRRGSDANS